MGRVGWSQLIFAEVCLLALYNDTLGKNSDLLRTLCVLVLEKLTFVMLRTQYYLTLGHLIAETNSSFTNFKNWNLVYPFKVRESWILVYFQPLLSPFRNIFILPPPEFPHQEAVTAHFLLPKSLLALSDCYLWVTLFWTLRLDEMQPEAWFLCLSHCVPGSFVLQRG